MSQWKPVFSHILCSVRKNNSIVFWERKQKQNDGLESKVAFDNFKKPSGKYSFFHKVICCESSSLVLVEEFPNEMCKRIYGDSKAAFISKYIRTATFSLSYYF